MALSDVKIESLKVYWDGVELGNTTGGVTLTPETASADIVSDQFGQQILDSYIVATNVTISVTLLELNATNYNKMIASAAGGTFTTAESGVASYGYGTSKNFTSMLSAAKVLELRDNTDATNSNSINIWKAFPIVNSLSFLADAPRTMEISFRCFADSTKDSAISIFATGDQDDTWA